MSNVASSAVRQASRLAARPSVSVSQLRGIQGLSRVAAASFQRPSSRSYVSETKRDSAQVNDIKIETAIRLDKKDFEKAGLAISANDGDSTKVSPMAGKIL